MLFDAPIRPFLPGEYRVKLAAAPWEVAGHHALRRAIFCAEQGIFAESDRDAIDAAATPIVALSCMLGDPDEVVGVVRIHEAEPGIWWGSRLGVHRDFRRIGPLGAELIRLAVSTAHARGCRTFLAHVQEQNVGLFRRLHWETLRELELHGRTHLQMRADLAHYAPHGRTATRLVRPLGARAA